jgi:endonuclease/exonuclease/phosphatase family metal-dependent hydrolase
MSGNDAERLRVATYNVHGCRGMDGRRSETRIAEVIAMLEVDVIGLQELDLNRRRSAGVDQVALIADQLGWHRVFHPALRVAGEQYGDAVLSRFPITLRQARELPSVTTRVCPESRAAIWVEIDAPGGGVQVINTHLGLGRRERFMQAELLAGPEWLGRIPADEPLILMGDFNSLPGSPAFRLLAQILRDARTLVRPAPRLRTFPTRHSLLAVDHILVNERLGVSSITVVRSAETRIASDHFPVVADLRFADGRREQRNKG